MLKEYIKPELTIETWKIENILTESGVSTASLDDSIDGDGPYRNLGSVEFGL